MSFLMTDFVVFIKISHVNARFCSNFTYLMIVNYIYHHVVFYLKSDFRGSFLILLLSLISWGQ